MYIKLIILSLTILGLTNCSETDGQTLYANRRTGLNDASLTGTGSGGGGYDDNAKIGVDIAKNFLSEMIQNSDDIVFEKFPDGFKKDNLIQIIQDLSYSGDERTRDNEPLLFDYDLETKKLFYTKQFVDKYGQYKFSSSAEDDLKNIKEYSSLILHELSHLMGIGQSKNLDPLSALFSATFLNHMLTETQICEGSLNPEIFSLVINPPTGMSYFVKDKVIEDFNGFGGYEIKESDLSIYPDWTLGSAFPFFELKQDNANGANQISVAEMKLELGVQSLSPYDLIDYLLGRDVDGSDIVFWNFENSKAEYGYKMVYNSLDSTGSLDVNTETGTVQPQSTPTTTPIEEIGLISLDTTEDTTVNNGLKIEVQLNGQLDADQSFNVPLNCQKFVGPYDLSSIIELNTTNEQDPAALEIKINRVSKKIVLENLMRLHGCDQTDLSDSDKLYCDSIRLQIQ